MTQRWIRCSLLAIFAVGAGAYACAGDAPEVPDALAEQDTPAPSVANDDPLAVGDAGDAGVSRPEPFEPSEIALQNDELIADIVDGRLVFVPESGQTWEWTLASFAGVQVDVGSRFAMQSASLDGGSIIVDRGEFVERYIDRGDAIEQQFVLPEPLDLEGEDLVIDGVVDHDYLHLDRFDEGWAWRTGEHGVTYGRAFVFDASGAEIPSRTRVNMSGTEIVVDGEALAQAAYPVTIDPLIGSVQRVSMMGTDGVGGDRDGVEAAIAMNTDDDEYLVVWSGANDGVGGQVEDEFEIFASVLDSTGAEVVGESDLRVSMMGINGDDAIDAVNPDVAWHSLADEYLVVWQGHRAPGEWEIYGQRLNENGGNVGPMLVISVTGAGANETNASYDATEPVVVANPAAITTSCAGTRITTRTARSRSGATR